MGQSENARQQPFSLEIPEYYNFSEQVDRYARTDPKKPAILVVSENGETESLSYEELTGYSNRIANALKSLGIGRKDKVLVLVPRGIEAYGIYLVLLKLGAVVPPGSEMLRSKDIEYRVNHCGARAVIGFAGIVEENVFAKGPNVLFALLPDEQ